MATVTKTPKQRKPRKLEPISGKCRWVGGIPSPAALDNGDALLLITPEGKEPAVYHVQCFDGNYRLSKAGVDEAVYDLERTGNGFRCNCADATFCEERPGGCKHAKALAAALAKVGSK